MGQGSPSTNRTSGGAQRSRPSPQVATRRPRCWPEPRVCGIAGAFTAGPDLTRLLRYLLDPTISPAPAGFRPAWTDLPDRPHRRPPTTPRPVLARAPGTSPVERTYTHYGFTGTALWINPTQRTWAVLLTNKLSYTRDRDPIAEVRNGFRQLVFD